MIEHREGREAMASRKRTSGAVRSGAWALAILAAGPAAAGVSPPIPGTPCGCFPADNIWNTDISTMPVHARSADWVTSIGAGKNLDLTFGPPAWGFPWNVTDASTPKVSIDFQDTYDSDPGPYPFTATTPIESGTSDYHALMVDRSTCTLYELYDANWNGGNPSAGNGAIFNLGSNTLRPDDKSSADDAGLPIFPGLVRADEVLAGEIRHAFRFTAMITNSAQGSHLWPARFEAHYAGGGTSPSIPPMGARFRLKAGYNISGYSAHAQVILRALQRYGMMLADIGYDWCLGGTRDAFWTSTLCSELRRVPANQFEAVDVSSLMIDPNSGQARQTGPVADTVPPGAVKDLR
jgi:hypothetical protein